ncbi:hypothetical protein C1646_765231 [Rhizophagus diaphanus]|nr:hypothetical protein C1646_765231 [Rhizophagus diaphanus] [Rhizophagus sp. MUCL 43196]
MSFKKYYRYYHIHWILEQIEASQFIQDLKISVLQAIQYIIQGWSEVTTETIIDDFLLNEIFRILEIINLSNSMGAKELLNIPEENIVYGIPEDIMEFIEIFKKQSKENTNDLNDLDEMDDSIEIVIVSTNVALKSLNTMHTFLLQQENSNKQIKLVNTIEKFVRKKQTQTTIHQYFSQ